MEVDDLPRIKEQLSKAIQGNKSKLVLTLLDDLFEFKATQESLKSTRIGVFVTDLRKHPMADEAIKQKSKDLVAKWKMDIGRPSTASSRNSSEPSTPQPVQERSCSSDNVKVKNLGDKVRTKCCEMLYNALATGTEEEPKYVLKVAEQVEHAVFCLFNGSDGSYKSRMRSLVSNLRDKNNPFLKLKVLSRKIEPDVFAKMTPEELMSQDRKAVVEQVKKANLADAVSAQAQHAETDMFKCGKCGQRKTTYFQMQTRSADEPMTTFVTCLHCNNRWKFC